MYLPQFGHSNIYQIKNDHACLTVAYIFFFLSSLALKHSGVEPKCCTACVYTTRSWTTIDKKNRWKYARMRSRVWCWLFLPSIARVDDVYWHISLSRTGDDYILCEIQTLFAWVEWMALTERVGEVWVYAWSGPIVGGRAGWWWRRVRARVCGWMCVHHALLTITCVEAQAHILLGIKMMDGGFFNLVCFRALKCLPVGDCNG